MAKSIAGRILRLLGYTVGTILVVYLIGANLILNTGILDPVINKKPEKTLIEWQSGYTFFPGFIHVEGLRVRGQSKGQQWQFRLGEADVRMALLPIANKTIRASRVRGSNFHFRLRKRLAAGDVGTDTSHQADIEGLSNPPDPAPEDIYPPKKKKKKRGWLIDVADIELTQSIELWVGDLKMTGDGKAGGDLVYQIPTDMDLQQAFFALGNGEIAIAGKTFVNQLDISLDANLGPFQPKEAKGLEIFNYLLGTFALENGTIPDIKVVNALMPPASPIELVDGTASFAWSFDKQSVEEGSNGFLQIIGEEAAMLMAGRSVDGNFSINTRLREGSLAQGHWVLDETTLAFDQMDIRLLTGKVEEGTEAPPAEEDLWWARFSLRSGEIDMGDPSLLRADFDFRMKNTEPIVHMAFAKETDEGTAKLPFWVKAIPDIQDVVGHGRIDAKDGEAEFKDVTVTGDKLGFTAWLHKVGDVTNAKAYMHISGHGLGVHVENGKRDIKILHPKRWALEQPELDPAAIEWEKDDGEGK